MRRNDPHRWRGIGLVAALFVALVMLTMQVRTSRVEAIRNQLWQLELGMTMQEVRLLVDRAPTREVEDRGLEDGRTVVVWSFAIRPKIEAVQPSLVFDRDTERLIEIVVDESRWRRADQEPFQR